MYENYSEKRTLLGDKKQKVVYRPLISKRNNHIWQPIGIDGKAGAK